MLARDPAGGAYTAPPEPGSAGLTIVPVVPWEGASAARGPTNCRFLPCCFEETFTNHKFHVGLHVTYGLNDRRIPNQYASWSAKGCAMVKPSSY